MLLITNYLFTEINTNEEPVVGVDETLIFSEKQTAGSFFGIQIAPGEDKVPVPLHMDENAEIASFPKIYCGQCRKLNPKAKLTYTDVAKSELLRYDRRACLPNRLLWSFKRSFNEKVYSSIQICLRKTKGNESLTAGRVKIDQIKELLQHDDGYAVFKSLRSSPCYWKEQIKRVLAMIRTKGKPTFFITFSSAETKWKELIVMLKKILKNETITEDDVSSLEFQEIAEMIRNDPVTCMRHFDHRLRALHNIILKEKAGVFAPHILEDHFTRLEFQMRGSPHSHGLYWIKDAPEFVQGKCRSN